MCLHRRWSHRGVWISPGQAGAPCWKAVPVIHHVPPLGETYSFHFFSNGIWLGLVFWTAAALRFNRRHVSLSWFLCGWGFNQIKVAIKTWAITTSLKGRAPTQLQLSSPPLKSKEKQYLSLANVCFWKILDFCSFWVTFPLDRVRSSWQVPRNANELRAAVNVNALTPPRHRGRWVCWHSPPSNTSTVNFQHSSLRPCQCSWHSFLQFSTCCFVGLWFLSSIQRQHDSMLGVVRNRIIKNVNGAAFPQLYTEETRATQTLRPKTPF